MLYATQDFCALEVSAIQPTMLALHSAFSPQKFPYWMRMRTFFIMTALQSTMLDVHLPLWLLQA